jgi:zinc/manganese transport system ATP-binding protein
LSGIIACSLIKNSGKGIFQCYSVTLTLNFKQEKHEPLYTKTQPALRCCHNTAAFCGRAARADVADDKNSGAMSLIFDSLTAGYDRHPAVHHLSGTLQDNSLTALIGPNGGGKSTLLKAITGLLKPLSGQIQHTKKCRIGYLPQVAEIDRSFPMSVYDTVLLGYWPVCGIWGGINAAQRHEALHALEKVGMDSFAHRPVSALSSGQFQRVLFARLMVQNADILLLDEPFAAIDSRTTADLLQVVLEWHKNGKTVVAVLHDLPQARLHFPEALLLARDCIAWNKTALVMTEDNLKKADNLARQWHDHGEICAA